MQVRVARHTDRFAEIVRFYRDGLGLREIGRFKDHDGYDGIFLALTGTETHLEFTTGGEQRGPNPHPDSLLVFYLGSQDAVSEACGRVGAQPVEPANPYWKTHGVTLVDPDGFRVVLVPDSWTLPA
jgi:catechol 2,3-dioxygenase-like lactoylglutathione lyase family enzyme